MTDKPGKSPDTRPDDESTVSRAYGELKRGGPPAHLDERILAEARRVAAAEDTTVVRVHRWRKWSMPAALAATVVVAVPLIVRVFENTAVDPETAPPTLDETMTIERLAADDADVARPPPSIVAPDRMLEDNDPIDELEIGRATRPVPAAPAETRQERIAAPAQPATTPEPAASGDESRRMKAPGAEEVLDRFAADEPGAFASAPKAVTESQESRESDAPAEIPTTSFAVAPAATPADRQDDRVDAREPRGAGEPDAARDFTVSGHAPLNAELSDGSGIEEVILTGSRARKFYDEPEDWLTEIARLHRYGRTRTARRELGFFLTEYPDYELPDYFPLRAEHAIYEDEAGDAGIVPEAEAWLRGIGKTVERGEIDAARMQLAEFLQHYPDYPLPDDFPLSRDDARIEE